MGWSYEYRIAYGIVINSWNNPGLKRLLLKLSDLVSYDKEMSPNGSGTVFIYLNSTYKTLIEKSGSYSFSSPDITGDEFNPPKHPIIHEIDLELEKPDESPEELLALEKISQFCSADVKPVWIRHSYISY